MKLDMHCHTVWSDGVNTAQELIVDAEEKWLEALFITDHDRVSFDHISDMRDAGLITVPSVEISTTNTRWDNKWLHMTYYAQSVSNVVLKVLETTRKSKLEIIGLQLHHLQWLWFYIDIDEFYAGVDWEWISNYDIARYVVSKTDNNSKLQELWCLEARKPHSDFYRKCLRRWWELYSTYSVWWDESYKPELWDISEMTHWEWILSIAHPNFTFSYDGIRGFLELYKAVYAPQLWISAIEINTKASKKWVEAILGLKQEMWDDLQLTFGSDCHRLGKPDDKHGNLWFENEFLSDDLIRREFEIFCNRLWL